MVRLARGGLVVVLLSLAGPTGLASQSSGLPAETARPQWFERWSALSPRADLPRLLPHTGAAAASLLWPAPRIGSFWTAGNPAGLRAEVRDTLTDFSIGYTDQGGTYRRPLDPGVSRVFGASAIGWRPMDPRFALLGRVVLDQDRFDPGTRSDVVEAYPTSPFVTIDTSSSATRRTRARLEGVGSWQFGRTAVGLTLGYETRAHETIASGLVRRTRQVVPGVVLGVSRWIGEVQIGGYGRYRLRAETIRLLERAANGQVIELRGLKEAPILDILNAYYRRIEEKAPSAGVTASGGLGRARWTLFGERARLGERLTRQESNDPASDRWDADGWILGGAFQRPLGGRRLLTVDGRYTSLSGSGDLVFDSAAVIFRATERALGGSAEVRWAPDSTHWGLVLGVEVRSERRLRNDLAVSLGSRVNGLTIGASVEVGRALSPGVYLSGTVAAANYSATSAFPAPAVLGVVYRTYTLPELDIAARQARPLLGALGLRWRAGPHASVWVVARGERLVPVDARGPSGFGPVGTRTTGTVEAGVTLR